jgi:hypothetical protein
MRRRTRSLESFQQLFVQVLDTKIAANGMIKNRTRITKREAVIEALLSKAEEGHPAALQMLAESYHRVHALDAFENRDPLAHLNRGKSGSEDQI